MGITVSDQDFRGVRVLQVTAIDTTVAMFLTPLIDALTAAGADVECAAYCGSISASLRERGYILHGIPFARRVFTLSHLGALWRLWRLMRRNRYDVVHVHTPVAGMLGRIAARLARVPVVIYTAHGFYFHERMHPVPRYGHLLIEKLLGRMCTDFLFTVSPEDSRTVLAARIIADKKLHCLNSVGVDLGKYDPATIRARSREELGLPSGLPIVVFIGRVVEEKGILDLLHAFEHLHAKGVRVSLLVVGETLPSDRARGLQSEINRIIQQSSLAQDIRFLGFRTDVPEIQQLADMLVLPSHREGMPVTVLEAMAMAKPVVATDIRGCREEVVDGETGLIVPPEDPLALADAIERIVCDPELGRRMGLAGRARAEAEYDQKRVVAEQVYIYAELLR